MNKEDISSVIEEAVDELFDRESPDYRGDGPPEVEEPKVLNEPISPIFVDVTPPEAKAPEPPKEPVRSNFRGGGPPEIGQTKINAEPVIPRFDDIVLPEVGLPEFGGEPETISFANAVPPRVDNPESSNDNSDSLSEKNVQEDDGTIEEKSNEKSSNGKADKHRCKKLDVCVIADEMNKQYTIFAIIKQKILLAYNDEYGFFERYTQDTFAVLLRITYQGTDMETLFYSSNVNAIFTRLLTDPDIQANMEDFDRNQPFVNVENGVIDLETGRLKNHSPEYKFCSVLHAKYLTKARIPKAFDDFVQHNFPAQEDIVLFWQVFFYLMSWIRTAKLAFYIKGQTNTGKSLIADLLAKFMGADMVARQSIPQLLSRWGGSGLVGKRLNISMEVERDTLNRGSEFKSIISCDTHAVEFKGKDLFLHKPNTALLLLGNGMLKVNPRIADKALLNRFLFMEALNPVERDAWDTHLLDKIWAERDSILTKAINIGIAWYHDGMSFIRTKTSERLSTVFKCPKGSLAEYLNECYDFSPSAKVWNCEIRDGFETWRKENGFYSKVSKNEFYEALALIASEHNLKPDKFRLHGSKGSRHGYWGLRPKEA